MLISDQQIHEIRDIIRTYHDAFVVNAIGPAAVAAEVLQKLKDRGIVSVSVSSSEEAYLYGMMLAALDDPKVQNMTAVQFRDHVRRNPVPLTETERRAVAMAQHHAAQHVVGLGNRIDQATGQLLIESDAAQRAWLRSEIRDRTAENIQRRESIQKLKSDLGWASKDWARDWDRIAVTEINDAMQGGVRDELRDRFGADVEVARIPLPDACQHCKRLYLGSDGAPRIFKLSSLEKNGHTNFGRKARDWLPVTGSTHPHCACQTVRIPPGWGFDEEGSLVPAGELGQRYKTRKELQRALQREGDLRKARRERRTVYRGIPIRIENEPGSVRRWTAPDGTVGETEMRCLYGYIEGTGGAGADAEEVDCYVGPDPRAPTAYVVHQQDVETGRYDEDKVMLGFGSEAEAVAVYRAHRDSPGHDVAVSPVAVEQLVRLYGDRSAPFWRRGQSIVPLVVVVQKSDQSSPSSAYYGPAARRSPSPGTASNHVFGSPPRPQQRMSEVARTVVESQRADNEAFRRDKSVYDVGPSPRIVRPIHGPVMESGIDKETISSNRERVERWTTERQGPINRANLGVEGDDDDDEYDTEDGGAERGGAAGRRPRRGADGGRPGGRRSVRDRVGD